MSCENSTVQTLKASGHRPTPQRLMILSAVRHANGHVTASEILDRVKRTYPYIDVSTVYRTLGVLKAMRVVSETDMGGVEATYEWIDDTRHHHLICRRCEGLTLLHDVHVEKLGEEIMAEFSFKPEMDHLAIFGLCNQCRSIEAKS